MKERYLIDYDKRNFGLGHQMGSFNYGLKVALKNDLAYVFHEEKFYSHVEEFFRFSEGETHINDLDTESLRRVKLPAVDLYPLTEDTKRGCVLSKGDIWYGGGSVHNGLRYYDRRTKQKIKKNSENKILFSLSGYEKRIKRAKWVDYDFTTMKDWFVEKYKQARKNDPIENHFDPNYINVAIHLRRGDLFHKMWKCNRRRLLSDAYYETIMQSIYKKFGKKVMFHIYTQAKDERWDFDLGNTYLNENKEKGIWAYPQPYNYQLHLDEDWRDDFDHMVRADILITSISAFGHFAGNLSENYKIVPKAEGFLRYENMKNTTVVDFRSVDDFDFSSQKILI